MPFQPGQSGNLKGRPRGQTVSAELRRQADPEAIAKRLLAIVHDPKASHKDVLAAAQLVLDRIEGRPLSRGVSVSAKVDAVKVLPALAQIPPGPGRALAVLAAVTGQHEPELVEETDDDLG